jgi:hypothetical protein
VPLSPRALRSRAPAAAFALSCAACSSNAASPSSASPDAAANAGTTVTCGAPSDTYTANLVKPGKLGQYTFTLVEAAPAPPDLNANVWTVKIADATGASPTLPQVMAYPFMPLMGHGSDQTPEVAANPDGTFTIKNVFLFMSGLWTITLAVLPIGDGGVVDSNATTTPPIVLDEAVYTFCVGDY